MLKGFSASGDESERRPLACRRHPAKRLESMSILTRCRHPQDDPDYARPCSAPPQERRDTNHARATNRLARKTIQGGASLPVESAFSVDSLNITESRRESGDGSRGDRP